MSDVNNKLYQRAIYMRNLLIAHVTGRRVNEADYSKLRHYFMGLAQTGAHVPDIVADNPDLAGLWQSLKYSHASHEDRQRYVIEQFEPFIARFSEVNQCTALKSAQPKINELTLQATWVKAIKLSGDSPSVGVEQMRLLVENLCHQILAQLKVMPDPRHHELTNLVSLSEQSLLLAPGKRYYTVVKELMAGTTDTLAAIESLRLEKTKLRDKTIHSSDTDKATAQVLISLYGSLASMLLGGFRVREMLEDGITQR